MIIRIGKSLNIALGDERYESVTVSCEIEETADLEGHTSQEEMDTIQNIVDEHIREQAKRYAPQISKQSVWRKK